MAGWVRGHHPPAFRPAGSEAEDEAGAPESLSQLQAGTSACRSQKGLRGVRDSCANMTGLSAGLARFLLLLLCARQRIGKQPSHNLEEAT